MRAPCDTARARGRRGHRPAEVLFGRDAPLRLRKRLRARLPASALGRPRAPRASRAQCAAAPPVSAQRVGERLPLCVPCAGARSCSCSQLKVVRSARTRRTHAWASTAVTGVRLWGIVDEMPPGARGPPPPPSARAARRRARSSRRHPQRSRARKTSSRMGPREACTAGSALQLELARVHREHSRPRSSSCASVPAAPPSCAVGCSSAALHVRRGRRRAAAALRPNVVGTAAAAASAPASRRPCSSASEAHARTTASSSGRSACARCARRASPPCRGGREVAPTCAPAGRSASAARARAARRGCRRAGPRGRARRCRRARRRTPRLPLDTACKRQRALSVEHRLQPRAAADASRSSSGTKIGANSGLEAKNAVSLPLEADIEAQAAVLGCARPSSHLRRRRCPPDTCASPPVSAARARIP